MSLLAKVTDALPGLMAEYRKTGGFTNWHGGPHKFDKFDFSKIGQGQGAQSFGHGLYTADYKPVAEDYKRTLSHEQPTYEHDQFGVVSPSKLKEYLASVGIAAGNGKVGKLKAMQIGAEVEKTARRGHEGLMRMHQSVSKGIYPDQKVWQRALEAATAFRHQPNPGHLYEAKIMANPEADFLYQNRPISQQSDKVRAALDDLGIQSDDQFSELKMATEDEVRRMSRSSDADRLMLTEAQKRIANSRSGMELFEGMNLAQEAGLPIKQEIGGLLSRAKKEAFMPSPYSTGHGALGRIANKKGGNPAASAALKERGVEGTRFLDAGSRDVGKGTYNTVLFSDEVIDIVKRYGIAALVTAGLITEEMARALEEQGIGQEDDAVA